MLVSRLCVPMLAQMSSFLFLIAGEKEYYEKQFATLSSFEEVDSLGTPSNVDEAQDIEEQVQSEFAMKISNSANVALLALKVIFHF